ncbi:MAG: hypothetical protein HQK74_09805 [Desulfamplus sp.]|nr:hypothetical protein [Desulfamplus sp.]
MLIINNLNLEYITDEVGKRKSVVLPISDFEELIEDIEDLAAVAQRKDESTISHNDFIDELKQNGFL